MSHPAATAMPVLIHYLDRAGVLLEAATRADIPLTARLAPDMLPLGAQFVVAIGFSLRAVAPFSGEPAPEVDIDAPLPHIRDFAAMARARLAALDPATLHLPDTVTHVAGEGEVTQDPTAFLFAYALPNMLFHLSMAYAILRANGAAVGKADFDGFHVYAN